MAGIDLSTKKKVAFVCSGGAVKAAAFHVGVAMALENKGFRFLGGTQSESEEAPTLDPSKTVRVYVGSSAGSLVSTFLAQGGKIKDVLSSFMNDPSIDGIPGLKYWEMLFPRVRSKLELFSWDNFFFNMLRNKTVQSPFSTNGIAKYLKAHVIKSDRFSELEPDLFIVATEVNQSKKFVFGKYKSLPAEQYIEYRNDVSVSDSCAASMALPPIYHPYTLQIDGARRDFFDGEIREPLSSHIARDIGCDLIICSYTHQPVRMHPSKGSLSDKGMHQVTLQAIYQAIEQKIQQSRGYRQKEKALIDAVRKFFKDRELPDALCEDLLVEIEARMTYKSNVDYIHIQPRASDQEMFLLPHFSLNRKKTERIVKKGFLAAMSALQGLKLEEDT